MINRQPQFYFLFAILLSVAVLTFFVFKPFLAPLVLAIIFGVAFKPLYKKILARMPEWESSAAALTLGIVTIFFIVPIVFLSIQLSQEVAGLYTHLASGGGKDGILGGLNVMLQRVQDLLPFAHTVSIDIEQYVKYGLEWILGNLDLVFSNIARLALDLFVFFTTLYYILKDGARLRKFLVSLSPLNNDDDEDILRKLEAASNSVVKGRLFIALVQGVLTGIAFTLFGVPNPMLWGSLAIFAALVPGIGTMLVFAPAVAYLLVVESALAGIGLLAFGVGVVGLVDNLMAPALLGRGTNLHPLLVLLSVLGGLALFGPVGIFLGPLVISLLIALLDLHFLLSSGKK